MSTSKLNLHSKSLFLQHRGKKVFRGIYPDGLISASEFLKYLIISRQFLYSTQLYKVYYFVVFKVYPNGKFEVHFSDVFPVDFGTRKFQLTLSEIDRLNQLFKIQNFYAILYSPKHANEYSALCNIFKGRISLSFFTNLQSEENKCLPFNIIAQVQSQLDVIECNVEVLVDLSRVPCLNLFDCYLLRTKNFYQIKKVLSNHKIKELDSENSYRYCSRFDEKIDDDYFNDFPTCYNLKDITFICDQLDESHEIISKMTQMVKYFPALTKIVCQLLADRYTSEQFDLQTLVTWVSKETKKIELLRKACPSTTYFQICYSFRVRKRESKQTIKQVVKNLLKTTNFNILCCFEQNSINQDPQSQQHFTVELEWNKHKFFGFLRIIVDLDLEEAENVVEEDDNLLIPLPSFFKFHCRNNSL